MERKNRPRHEAISTPAAQIDEAANKPHLLAAAYYVVQEGTETTLTLNNKSPNPLEVTPTIFGSGGARLDVPPVVVEGSSFTTLDLRQFGALPGGPFQDGSVQVAFLGKDFMLGAQVKMVDAGRSLIFDEQLTEPAAMFSSSRLEGVWWLPSRKSEVRLVLSNTTDAPLSANVGVDGIAPKQKEPEALSLAPHETRVLELQDVAKKRGGMLSDVGGISVEHTGLPGGLLARALIQEPARGYSAVVEFFDPHKAVSSRLQGAGLRVGKLRGEPLSPVVVARNIGGAATSLTGRILYTAPDGGTAAAALQEMRLHPGETKLVSLAGALRSNPALRDGTQAGLEFEYAGEPGTVLMSAQSVSGGGTQVFRVPLIDPAAQKSSTGEYPWDIGGDSTTVVYIKNVTDRPQVYNSQLNFSGGLYAFGLKTLEAGQTIAIDIRDLRDRQVPDANGRPLPPEATSGQVHWSMHGMEPLVMIGRAEQADITRGISSSYACHNCCPDSFMNGWLDPGFGDGGLVGDQAQFFAIEQDQSCYGAVLDPYQVSALWDSSDPSVASCDSTGLVTTTLPGFTSIRGSWDYIQYVEPYCGMLPQSFLAEAACDVYEPADCTIGLKTDGPLSPGDNLTLPRSQTTLGFKEFNDQWAHFVELFGTVSDDAATWALKQSYTGKKKVNTLNANGTVNATQTKFLNAPQDSPDAPFRQQEAGAQQFFWIDGPGHFTLYDDGKPVYNLTQVQNFVSWAQKGRAICRVRWHLKLEVFHGQPIVSECSTGHISTNF